MKATETKKLPLGLKLGYGGAEGGVTASQNLVYVFLMIFLTDVDGVMDNADKLISSVDAAAIQRMIAEKTVTGGMIPKIEYALDALENKVEKAHIINGKKRHALLLELFTDEGIGTEVKTEEKKADG